MKWSLILLPLVLTSELSGVRNRRSGQALTSNSASDSSSSSQDDGMPSQQQSSEPDSYVSDIDTSTSSSSTEVSSVRVLNRVKWHGSLISASQAIILPISSSLLTFNPGRIQFISGILLYTVGLIIEAYSHKDFQIVPDVQLQFLVAKMAMMVLSVAVALQIDLDIAGSFASTVNILLISMSMLTLFLPYIRLHGLKDL